MHLSKPVLFVGEAFGEAEAKLGVGLVGASGVELLRMLDTAGVIKFDRADHGRISQYFSTGNPHNIDRIWANHQYFVRRTNVFNQHPPGNRLEYFCGPKAEGIPGYVALVPGKYVRRSYLHELDRLGDEILDLDGNWVRVAKITFESIPEGVQTYVSQTEIDHTPVKEKLRLPWGLAFDIACGWREVGR
jgi:uracil-DNA glycosylase